MPLSLFNLFTPHFIMINNSTLIGIILDLSLGSYHNIKYGARVKVCPNCEMENAIAKRNCKSCGEAFPKKNCSVLSVEKASGTSNITSQRKQLFKRLRILQKNHGYDTFCISIKKGKRNIVLDHLSTPGFAENFFGGNTLTTNGELITQAFRQEFVKYYSSSENGDQSNLKSTDTTYELNIEANDESNDIVTDDELQNDIESPLREAEEFSTAAPVQVEHNIKATLVRGLEVTKKEDIKIGHLIPVYAEASSNDSYWIFRVTNPGKRKISGFWLQNTKALTYSDFPGGDSIVWKNVVQEKSSGKSYFTLSMKFENGHYVITEEAHLMLLSLCS